MQRGRGEQPPIGIALEGDLAHRLDALMAIAMLNGLSAKNECRLIALCLSRPTLRGAQLVEAVAAFFNPRSRGEAGMVGMPAGAESGEAPGAATILDLAGPDGPRYETLIEGVLDTADNAVLIRNRLLAQNDGNAAIVLAGPATGLVRLMNLYGARPQIEAKAARLVLAVGEFGPGASADPAVVEDVAAMRTVLAEWPTPVVFAGREVGRALAYPADRFTTDFTWAPAHPIVDAYAAAAEPGTDVPASALAALLYAVHPETNLLGLSAPGDVVVADDGRTTFSPTPEGRHRYLMVDEARRAEAVALISTLVAAPPTPPRRRRGGPPPAANPPQQEKPAAPPAPVPAPAPPAPS